MATRKKAVKKVEADVEEMVFECKDKRIIDVAPLWAKYYAVDGNGKAYYYDEKPTYAPDEEEDEFFEWSSNGEFMKQAPKVFSAKLSLMKIPDSRIKQVITKKLPPTKEDITVLTELASKYLNRED